VGIWLIGLIGEVGREVGGVSAVVGLVGTDRFIDNVMKCRKGN
jgi:hypothetical protein